MILIIILILVVIYLFITLGRLQNKIADINVSMASFLSACLTSPLDYIKDREIVRSLQKKFLYDLFDHVDRTSDNINEYEKRVGAVFTNFGLILRFDDSYEIDKELMETLLDHIEVEYDSLHEKSEILHNKSLERRKTIFK